MGECSWQRHQSPATCPAPPTRPQEEAWGGPGGPRRAQVRPGPRTPSPARMTDSPYESRARGPPHHLDIGLPDLSHLTPEERAIIHGVMQKQQVRDTLGVTACSG